MTREEAITKLHWLKRELIKGTDMNEPIDMAIEALSAVCDDCIWHVCNYNKVDWDAPSAEAEHGEWIDIDNYYRLATCSHCHKVTMFEKWGEYTKPYDFCPNCGAKMIGGDDE